MYFDLKIVTYDFMNIGPILRNIFFIGCAMQTFFTVDHILFSFWLFSQNVI